MKSLKDLPLRDAWAIWFCLGLVMLNYPFLHIFNKEVQLFGVPLTILYFFIGWPTSIAVIYMFSIYLGRDQAELKRSDLQNKSDGEKK